MADMVFVKDDALMPSDWAFYCSNCKNRISRAKLEEISYCPYCGSKIENWTAEETIWIEDFLNLR